MRKSKRPSIPMLMIMIVIASALAREFNLDTLSFTNTALASIYIFTLLLCFFFIWYGAKKR